MSNQIYYKTTHELSGKNMISSHVKGSPCYLWYGYIINLAFRSEKLYLREMVWYFVGVYISWPLDNAKFLLVLKNISLVRTIFFDTRKFRISKRL